MICTFYSYKGGVGRSMALANAADILARRGLRVLMIDFDLEAPGLEQYFPIPQERVLRRLGLLDLLLSYKQAMSATEEAPDEPAFKRLQELFLQPVYGQLPAGGKLDLLHAGQRGDAQQLARYALDLRMFDWQDFYLNWEGEAFFEWLRRTLVPDLYDVVLVDSRTGVTEMGGICAYQLADAIVMFCAANKQNLDGTRSLVADFFSPRVTARRRNRPLQVLIVPARIEQRDAALLAGFREGFEKAFEAYTPEPLRQDRLGFWDLLIPYTPLYAFDERVVARPDRPAQRQEIASSFRTLVEAISRLAEPGTALERLSPRSGQEREAEPPRVQYDVTRSFSGYDAVLFYDVADRGIVETITERLRVAGLSLFTMQQGVRGEESRELFASSLEDSKALLWFSGAAVLTASQQKELRQALDRARDDPDFRLIEVELPGSRPVEQSLGVRGGVGADLIRLSLRAGGEPEAVQQILKILRPEVAAEVPATAFAEGPPFLGLRPFREEDASLFFGREELVAGIIERLPAAQLLAVVGASGAGKSSLIQAGVLPALRSGALPGSELWCYVTFRPGAHPLLGLAFAILSLDRTLDPERRRALLSAIASGELYLVAVLQEILAESRLVLFIDQLEELFTVCEDGRERQSFLAELAKALEAVPIYVLLALRADFYPRCLEHQQLSLWLQSRTFNLGPMSRQDLRRAIESPAQRAGLAFEPGVVERLLEEVGEESGALPALQFLLFSLWERRREGWLTNAALQQIGGLRGALAYRADETYARLKPEEQEAVRRVVLTLVRVGDTGELTRRRSPLADLAPGRATERAVQSLIDARLIIVDRQDGVSTVELAHDSILRNWPRALNWIDESRELLLWRGRLAASLRQWVPDHAPDYLLRGAPLAEAQRWAADRSADLTPDELGFIEASARRQARSQRRILTIAAVISFVFLCLAAWASYQWRLAAQASRSSLARSLALQAYSQMKDNPDLALLLSVEASRVDNNPETRGSLAAVLQQNPQIRTIRYTGIQRVEEAAFQPHGEMLALRGADQRVVLWNRTGRILRLPAEARGRLVFSPDGKVLATVEDYIIHRWNVATGQAVGNPLSVNWPVIDLTFNPAEDELAVACVDQRIRLFHLASQTLEELPLPNLDTQALAFSPDGRILAVGLRDGRIELWHRSTGETFHLQDAFRGGSNGLTKMTFSSDGRTLAVGEPDGPVRLWDVESRKLTRQLHKSPRR